MIEDITEVSRRYVQTWVNVPLLNMSIDSIFYLSDCLRYTLELPETVKETINLPELHLLEVGHTIKRRARVQI